MNTNHMMALQALLEKSSDSHLLPEMTEFAVGCLMALEAEGLTGIAHGVVASDNAWCVEAQDFIDLLAPEQRYEGCILWLGRHREAVVMVGQAAVLDKAVGFLDGGDADEVEFLDKTVLEGAEGALGATSRFGGVGGDVLDAELMQGAPAARWCWSRCSPG